MSAAESPIAIPASLAPPLHTRISHMFTALWRSRGAVRFGMVVIGAMLLMSLLAPWVSPHDVNAQDMYNLLAGPSAAHWLGTDNLGRDMLTRIIWGGRVPLTVAVLATVLAAVIGVTVGLISGMAGGWLDALLMRTADAFICFPALLFVLVLAAIIGPGIHNVIISFAVFGWTGFARITRGQVMLVRELQYIEAARAIGMSRARLLRLHVLPNVLAPLIVASSLTAGNAILVEAGASFLGVGVQPPAASWGAGAVHGFQAARTGPANRFRFRRDGHARRARLQLSG